MCKVSEGDGAWDTRFRFCDNLETGGARTRELRSWSENVAECCMPGEGRAPTCFRNGRRLAWTGCLCGGRPDDVSRRGRVFWLAACTRVSHGVTYNPLLSASYEAASAAPCDKSSFPPFGALPRRSILPAGATDHDQLEPLSFTSSRRSTASRLFLQVRRLSRGRRVVCERDVRPEWTEGHHYYS